MKTTINVSVIASKVQQDTNEKTQDKPNVSLLQRSSAKQSLSSCGTEASTGAQLELIQNRFAPLLWSWAGRQRYFTFTAIVFKGFEIVLLSLFNLLCIVYEWLTKILFSQNPYCVSHIHIHVHFISTTILLEVHHVRMMCLRHTFVL